MSDKERSEQLCSSDTTSRQVSSPGIGATLSHQINTNRGASHETHGSGHAANEEGFALQPKGEEAALRPESRQGYEEGSSNSLATFAQIGHVVPTPLHIRALAHAPNYTFPSVSAALPSWVDPSTALQPSPASCMQASSNAMETPYSAAAPRGGLAPGSCPLYGVRSEIHERAGALGSQRRGDIHCVVCALSVPRSAWAVHQSAAAHQRRLREHAIASDGGGNNSNTSSARIRTVEAPSPSMGHSTLSSAVEQPQRHAVPKSTQQAAATERPSVRTPAQARDRRHRHSQVPPAVVGRLSSRGRQRRVDLANSYTTPEKCSTSSNESRSGSGQPEGSAACAHLGVDCTSHVTLLQQTAPPPVSVAARTPTSSFELPPVSLPCFSEESSASGVAHAVLSPGKTLELTERVAPVHYVELTSEQRERRRVRELERQLHKYLYYREKRLLSACVRRWYGVMFSKATAPIADLSLPKRLGGAHTRSDAFCSPRNCAVTSLSSATPDIVHIRATSPSPSPSPISEAPPSRVDAVACRFGVRSVPQDSMGPAATGSMLDTMPPRKSSDSHYSHGRAASICEDNAPIIARRSDTQRPVSPRASMPGGGESTVKGGPEVCGAKCVMTSEFEGVHHMRTEHAGVVTTSEAAAPTPVPFLTTHVKSYAHVYVAADGHISPAEVHSRGDDDNAEDKTQDLEVMRTDVRWVVVRPASRLAVACSSSSESSSGVTDGKDLWCAVGRGDAARASAAAAAAATSFDGKEAVDFPVDRPGGGTAWGPMRSDGARQGGNNCVPPQYATEGDRVTESVGLRSLHQPFVLQHEYDFGRHEGGIEGDACEHSIGPAPLSQRLPEQSLDEPSHTKRHPQSCSANAEGLIPRSKKSPHGFNGAQRAEESRLTLRTLAQHGEGEKKSGCVPQVHQPLSPAVVSDEDIAAFTHVLIGTEAEVSDGGSAVRADGSRRHVQTPVRGVGERVAERNDSGFAANTTAASASASGAYTGDAEAGQDLCKLPMFASRVTEKDQATYTSQAEPLYRQSNLEESLPPHPSHAPPLARGRSGSSESLRCTLAKASSSSSSSTLTDALHESSSSFPSSLSSRSTNTVNDRDVAGPTTCLSLLPQQRVCQGCRPEDAGYTHMSSTNFQALREDTSDNQHRHGIELKVPMVRSPRRLTKPHPTACGEAAAHGKEDSNTMLGHPSDYRLSSAPLMTQHTRRLGATTTTTPPRIADICHVLTGVSGRDATRIAASGALKHSNSDSPHGRRHRRRKHGMNPALRLPKTMLALHMLSVRRTGSSATPLPQYALGECDSKWESDAAPVPAESNDPVVLEERNAESQLLSPPCGHRYNITDQSSTGNSGGGGGGAGLSSFPSSRLRVRRGSKESEGSRGAELLSIEGDEKAFPACVDGLASSVDEGGQRQGADAPEKTSTLGKEECMSEALLPSAPPPNGVSIAQSSALPSLPSSTALSERDIRTAFCAPPAVQAPRQPSPSPASSLVLKSTSDPGLAESLRGRSRDQAGLEAQRPSLSIPVSTDLPHHLDFEHRGGTVEQEWDLGLDKASSTGARQAQVVGGVIEGAVPSHADVAHALHSPSRAAPSEPVGVRVRVAERVPSPHTRHFHKTISDGPAAVLPSTNRFLAGTSSSFRRGLASAVRQTESATPIAAQVSRHLDTSRGATQCIHQSSDGQSLSLDQHITVTLTTSAAINFNGNESLQFRSPVFPCPVAKTMSNAPQDGHCSTPTADALDSKFPLCCGGGPVDITPPRASDASRVLVGSSHPALNDTPSLEVPALNARGDRVDFAEKRSCPASSERVRERDPRGSAATEAPVGVRAAHANSSGQKDVLPPDPSPAYSSEPCAGVQPSVLDMGCPSFDRGMSPGGVAGLPEATGADALTSEAVPAAVVATHLGISSSLDVMPTAHPYCYTAIKGGSPRLRSTNNGDRSKGGHSAITSLRWPLDAPPFLLQSVPSGASDQTADASHSPPALTAAKAARHGAADELPRRSSSLHARSADLQPHRRKSHRHRSGHRLTASLERRRTDSKSRKRSGGGSNSDVDAAPTHRRKDRCSKGNYPHEEGRDHQTFRSRQRCHRCLREKRFASRHRRDRLRPEDAGAATALWVHSPRRRAHEAVMQWGSSDAYFPDQRCVAQKAGGQLVSDAYPPHPYRVTLPFASILPRTSGQEMPTRGKECNSWPSDPDNGDIKRGAEHRRLHCYRGSRSLSRVKHRGEGDDVLLSSRKHRIPRDRDRTRGSPRRASSASVFPTLSWVSEGSSGRSSAYSEDDRDTEIDGRTHRGCATARVGVAPGTDEAVTRGFGRAQVLGSGKEFGESPQAWDDGVRQNLKGPLQQSIFVEDPDWGERDAQPPLDLERGSAGAPGRYAKLDAHVSECSGSPANAGAGRSAGGSWPVRGKDACDRGMQSIGFERSPRRVDSVDTPMQKPSAGDNDGVLPSGVPFPRKGIATPSSFPACSAIDGEVPGFQVQRGGAHELAFVSTENVKYSRRDDVGTTGTSSGSGGQYSADKQPVVLPQHGDVFYRDSAGIFHRVTDRDLLSVLECEAGGRSSPRHLRSPSRGSRRPLFIVHNPTPSISANGGRKSCAVSPALSRRGWRITNPSKLLGCARLNPYCSSCRAKYNLIFVDPHMRPVQWTSAHSAELDQMGDCRIHSGYLFGGGDTESTRDAMLVQQRLRSARMATWPQLPRLGKHHLLVHQEDLDGPLRHLAPPPQGRFVSVAFEEDERVCPPLELRQRVPLVSASVRQTFTLSPRSAALSQPARRSSPRAAFSGALQPDAFDARDKTRSRSPASSVPLCPGVMQNAADSHGGRFVDRKPPRNSPRHERRYMDSYNTASVDGVSSPQPGGYTGVPLANSGQLPVQGHSLSETVATVRGAAGGDATVGAGASLVASGTATEASDIAALCQEERQIKKALKQLLWHDLPRQRGTTEWEDYVRSLSAGLRQQLHLGLSPPSLPLVQVEKK